MGRTLGGLGTPDVRNAQLAHGGLHCAPNPPGAVGGGAKSPSPDDVFDAPDALDSLAVAAAAASSSAAACRAHTT